MQTETFMQMVDRMVIAQLKSFHYTDKGRFEEATASGEHAKHLRIAIDTYFWECCNGVRVPRVHTPLRFHDHSKLENVKSEDPDSLAGCIALLAQTHFEYWELQSGIQQIKKDIDLARKDGDKPYENQLSVAFSDLQRDIDVKNSRRNELIQLGDELFAIGIIDRNTR